MARIATNELSFMLCDLWGNQLEDGMIIEHIAGSGEVERTLNGPSLAAVAIDIAHPAAYLARKANGGGALTRMVKAFYAPTKHLGPVYTGILLEPGWSASERIVALSFTDAWFRLQRAYLATPYNTPDGGRDIGQVMWDLIARAANRAYPLIHPGLGITQGTIQATYNINRNYDAGENIGDAIMELSQLAGAPDISFKPLHRTDGKFWEFTALTPGNAAIDATATCWFECNTGLDNCIIDHAPSGDPVANYYTAMGRVPDDETLTPPMGYARHDASIIARGIYEGWDTNDAEYVVIEQAKAQEMVSAYFEPPDYLTIVPNPEAPVYPRLGAPPRWQIDYNLGYVVRAIARMDSLQLDIGARVMSDRITEDDESGATRLELDVAPNVDPSGVTVF